MVYTEYSVQPSNKRVQVIADFDSEGEGNTSIENVDVNKINQNIEKEEKDLFTVENKILLDNLQLQ